MGPPPKKGSAGGTALTVIGALCLCGCLFFGYFSWANAQSARRLSSSIGPRGGGFVVDIVRRKSERQQNYAIVFGVLAVAFIGGGSALKKKAKGAAGPAMHPGMMPPQGMHPGMMPPHPQGMQQPGMPPQGMQQPGMQPQGVQQPGMPPQGGYPPQGGGGMPQA